MPQFLILKKISRRERFFFIPAAVEAALEIARKLAIGREPTRAEWRRVPDYVRPALEALRSDRPRYQSSRLVEPSRPDDPRRWLIRLGNRLVPTDEADLPNYDQYFSSLDPGSLSPDVFTDAALEAAVLAFQALPDPPTLRAFLKDWWKKHGPSKLSEKLEAARLKEERRQRRLVLTDDERQLLRTAKAGAPIPNSPTRRLTKFHVCIAKVLACWKCGIPSHEQLASAAKTSIRTVRRALPDLRALGLLPEGIRGGSKLEMPKRVWGFQKVMNVFASNTGRSEKTLYRWVKQYRECREEDRLLEEPREGVEPPSKKVWPKDRRARRKRE
jgi:hypothetical protein